MSDFFSSVPVLTNEKDIRQALLNRVPEEARDEFFTPLHPQEMSIDEAKMSEEGVRQAIELLQQAVNQQSRTVIFGDYDCDGITSTAILWLTLRELGLTTRPFLPRRDVHGYGLSISALEELWAQEPFEVLVTVDNGIVAHPAVEWLKDKGVIVIITDHHTPSDTLPQADAIAHSRLLSGAGVAWILARELKSSLTTDLLDLATIGTLADQVPLYGANRSLVVYGLPILARSQRPSLQIMSELAGLKGKPLSSTGVTFGLAPRLNAMGRLADPMDALRALISQQPSRTRQLVATMETTNQARQDLTRSLFPQLQEQVTSQRDQQQSVLIGKGNFHEGVIGLLASQLVEAYGRPAIVLSQGEKVWKASGRSVRGINLIEVLRQIQGVSFASLGGHAQAAGFSLNLSTAENDLVEIQKQLSEIIPNYKPKNRLEITGNIDIQLLNSAIFHITQQFQPFGSGNEEPLFLLQNIRCIQVKPVGKQKNHWQCQIHDLETGIKVPAIFFKAREKYENSPETIRHVAVRFSPSTFGSREFDVQIAQAWGEAERTDLSE